MSAIKKIGDNELRRDVVSSDQTTVYTDGYKNLFTSSTAPQDINEIRTGTLSGTPGQITLSNIYVPGTDNLEVYVNGILLLQPGVDFTEVDNRTIVLSAHHIGTLDDATSAIKIVWNRPLPGSRDQLLNNLKNVTPDIESSILDPGVLRAALATAANPLATLADILDLGFASGGWQFRGQVNFGTGVTTSFNDFGVRPEVPSPGFATYAGDTLSQVLAVGFSMAHTNSSGMDGGASDQALLGIGGVGTSAINNVPAGDSFAVWTGIPSGLVYEGGTLFSPNNDLTIGGGLVVGSNGGVFYGGNTSFWAIGIK